MEGKQPAHSKTSLCWMSWFCTQLAILASTGWLWLLWMWCRDGAGTYLGMLVATAFLPGQFLLERRRAEIALSGGKPPRYFFNIAPILLSPTSAVSIWPPMSGVLSMVAVALLFLSSLAAARVYAELLVPLRPTSPDN